MRFVVRMAQRNWLRKKKITTQSDSIAVGLDSQTIDDPDQMIMFNDE